MNQIAWIGAAGLVFGLAALLVSQPFLSQAAEDWQVIRVTAAVAAFLLGGLVWGLLPPLSPKIRGWQGVLAGALVGLLAHPLAWYLAILYFYLTGARSSLGEATLDPWTGLPASLLLALGSWLFAGWLTVPVGALLGGLLATLQARWPGR